MTVQCWKSLFEPYRPVQAILREYAKGESAMLLSSITAQPCKEPPLQTVGTTNEE